MQYHHNSLQLNILIIYFIFIVLYNVNFTENYFNNKQRDKASPQHTF